MTTKQSLVLVDLLKDKPHSVCAEIGVWKGETTKYLLDKLPDIKKYYAVDGWELYEDFNAILKKGSSFRKLNYEEVFNGYKKRINKHKDKVETLKKYSKEAAKLVPDESLDFIFIDANHAYEYIKEDIELWYPKVKKGGILSGHDYNKNRFGVTKAVDERFDKVNVLDASVFWLYKEAGQHGNEPQN